MTTRTMRKFVIREKNGSPHAISAKDFSSACQLLGLSPDECTGEILKFNATSPATAFEDCTPPRTLKFKPVLKKDYRFKILEEAEELLGLNVDEYGMVAISNHVPYERWQNLKSLGNQAVISIITKLRDINCAFVSETALSERFTKYYSVANSLEGLTLKQGLALLSPEQASDFNQWLLELEEKFVAKS